TPQPGPPSCGTPGQRQRARPAPRQPPPLVVRLTIAPARGPTVTLGTLAASVPAGPMGLRVARGEPQDHSVTQRPLISVLETSFRNSDSGRPSKRSRKPSGTATWASVR